MLLDLTYNYGMVYLPNPRSFAGHVRVDVTDGEWAR